MKKDTIVLNVDFGTDMVYIHYYYGLMKKMTPKYALCPEHFRELGELERRMMWATNTIEMHLAANKIICRGLELEAQGFIVPTRYGKAAYFYKEIANQHFYDLMP